LTEKRIGSQSKKKRGMNIVDVVESFELDDQKIKNPDPPPPGIWTGWFLYRYQGPGPDDPAR
jgi:hypothetical protein